MNEFNCMTEANYQHRQAVRDARQRQHRRKVTKASRRAVTLVALDAALLGATAVALIVMVVCAVMGG
jgi:hypothetical protein